MAGRTESGQCIRLYGIRGSLWSSTPAGTARALAAGVHSFLQAERALLAEYKQELSLQGTLSLGYTMKAEAPSSCPSSPHGDELAFRLGRTDVLLTAGL